MKRFVLMFAVLLGVAGIAPVGVEASGGGATVLVAPPVFPRLAARRAARRGPAVFVNVQGVPVHQRVNGFGVPVYSYGVPVQTFGGCCNGGVQSFGFQTFSFSH